MLSIRDVGTEILTNNPRNFYIFVGEEYGIKSKYINHLSQYYHNNVIEANSVMDTLAMMKTKHIIPLNPSLYIIRYDDTFISKLSSTTADEIKNTNIIGTIVCIYEQAKHTAKLCKYLDTYTVSIDKISSKFIIKYLHDEFPELPDRLITLIATRCRNYSEGRNICASISNSDVPNLSELSDKDIIHMFGIFVQSNDDQIRIGLASRNFKLLMYTLDNYDNNYDNYLYTMLSTLIELEKLSQYKYSDSDVREYIKLWTVSDIYNMFIHTYDVLKVSRQSNSSDTKNNLVYLASLVQFQNIPTKEDML